MSAEYWNVWFRENGLMLGKRKEEWAQGYYSNFRSFSLPVRSTDHVIRYNCVE